MTIVENHRPRSSREAPLIVEPTPLLEIGGDESDSTQHLFQVSSVLLMPDGGVLIGNFGTRQLLSFDSTGVRRRTIGRAGEGPEEFRAITGLIRCAADTVLVNEFTRLSVLDSAHRFIRKIDIVPHITPRRDLVIGASGDCSSIVLAGRDQPPDGREPVSREEAFLYRAELNGAEPDTIARFPGATLVRLSREAGVVRNYLPWAGFPVYAVARDRVFFGTTERPEIRIHERGRGLTRIVRWPSDPQPITAADRARFDEARRLAVAEEPRADALFGRIDEFPSLPDHKPVFSRLLIDDEDRIWVREYPHLANGRGPGEQWDAEFEGGPQSWWLFDAEGRLLGTVRTPGGLVVLSVEGGILAGVRRGEYGVERVSLHRLVTPQGQ